MSSKLGQVLREAAVEIVHWLVTYRKIAAILAILAAGLFLSINLFLYEDYGGLLFTVKLKPRMQTGLDMWKSVMGWQMDSTNMAEKERNFDAVAQEFGPFEEVVAPHVKWDAHTAQSVTLAGSKIAQPRPESGYFISDAALPRGERLVVDATRMRTDVQIVLHMHSPMNLVGSGGQYLGAPQHIFSLVVRAGDRVDTLIPAGYYRVIGVTGLLWSGDHYGFFPGGYGNVIVTGIKFGGTHDYLAATEKTIKIEKRERKYRGYSFTLHPHKDDNPGFREVRVKRIKNTGS